MRRLAAPRTFLAVVGLVALWTISSAGCASEGEEVGEAPRSRGGFANQGGASGNDGELPPEGTAGDGGADQTGSGGSIAGAGGTDDVGAGGALSTGGQGGDGVGGSDTGVGGAQTSGGAPPVDPNACVPGTSEVVGTCGKCGQATRVCSAAGAWGTPACAGEGVCTPGQQEKAACGDCGEKTRTCAATCQWGGFSACGGEGVCKPGATKASGSCDPCQVVTCTAACNWGTTCKLKAGAACAYEEGTNFRCCGNDKWQFCSSSCEYHPCGACSSASCRAQCN